eukprot:scaffold80044_cov41-Prasinocladus_malaysianus.AAC.2
MTPIDELPVLAIHDPAESPEVSFDNNGKAPPRLLRIPALSEVLVRVLSTAYSWNAHDRDPSDI